MPFWVPNLWKHDWPEKVKEKFFEEVLKKKEKGKIVNGEDISSLDPSLSSEEVFLKIFEWENLLGQEVSWDKIYVTFGENKRWKPTRIWKFNLKRKGHKEKYEALVDDLSDIGVDMSSAKYVRRSQEELRYVATDVSLWETKRMVSQVDLLSLQPSRLVNDYFIQKEVATSSMVPVHEDLRLRSLGNALFLQFLTRKSKRKFFNDIESWLPDDMSLSGEEVMSDIFEDVMTPEVEHFAYSLTQDEKSALLFPYSDAPTKKQRTLFENMKVPIWEKFTTYMTWMLDSFATTSNIEINITPDQVEELLQIVGIENSLVYLWWFLQ